MLEHIKRIFNKITSILTQLDDYGKLTTIAETYTPLTPLEFFNVDSEYDTGQNTEICINLVADQPTEITLSQRTPDGLGIYSFVYTTAAWEVFSRVYALTGQKYGVWIQNRGENQTYLRFYVTVRRA